MNFSLRDIANSTTLGQGNFSLAYQESLRHSIRFDRPPELLQQACTIIAIGVEQWPDFQINRESNELSPLPQRGDQEFLAMPHLPMTAPFIFC